MIDCQKSSLTLRPGTGVLLPLFAVLLAQFASAEEAKPLEAKPAIGDKLAAMTFKDIRYLPRSLSDLQHKSDPTPKRVFVLAFTNTTCPLVQKYLPRLKDLDQKYRDRGVQVIAVNVGADDSILEMATQAVKFDVPFPFVKDMDGNCVRACGVERTPETVVIDAEHRLRYRGRIDNQYRLGGTAPAATTTELEDAIEALLAGREVPVAETPVDGCKITPPMLPKPRADLSYADVAPLFERHCNECHRPGTAAPFTLSSYDDVAAHSEMIAEVVAEGRMPPWYASEEFGKFEKCRRLPKHDRDAILGWLRAGMPGKPESAAQPNVPPLAASSATSEDGFASQIWRMEEPDWVLSVPGEYKIPADGYVDYHYALLPHVTTADTWIEQIEILPDNPRVVHHCNMGYVALGGNARNARLITGHVPGNGPMLLGGGVAVKLPRGSLIGLQIHFTTTGKPEICRLRIGFRFPRSTVQKELRYVQINQDDLEIPPFAPAHPVVKSRTVNRDVTAVGLFTHMHVRGKDITFRAHPPGRDAETMMIVPNYNFDWQMPYHLPRNEKKYPAGTRFECTAHFDNSTFNAYNPDPTATVREGQQTTSEMMYGYVFYTEDDERLELPVDPKTGHARK